MQFVPVQQKQFQQHIRIPRVILSSRRIQRLSHAEAGRKSDGSHCRKPAENFIRIRSHSRCRFPVPGRKLISDHLGGFAIADAAEGRPFPCSSSPKTQISTDPKILCCCGNPMLEFLRRDQL
jgi:hypothetical protein